MKKITVFLVLISLILFRKVTTMPIPRATRGRAGRRKIGSQADAVAREIPAPAR